MARRGRSAPPAPFGRRGRSAPPTSLTASLLQEEEKGIEIQLDDMSGPNKEETEEVPKEDMKKPMSMSLIMLCVAMFANSYALMNPIPYAPFMVLDFGVVDTKEDTGFWAGLIMSSFQLGRFLSSFVCGRISDKISRKFVIRAGLISCLVFQLGFGLAPTYSFALLTRLLMVRFFIII